MNYKKKYLKILLLTLTIKANFIFGMEKEPLNIFGIPSNYSFNNNNNDDENFIKFLCNLNHTYYNTEKYSFENNCHCKIFNFKRFINEYEDKNFIKKNEFLNKYINNYGPNNLKSIINDYMEKEANNIEKLKKNELIYINKKENFINNRLPFIFNQLQIKVYSPENYDDTNIDYASSDYFKKNKENIIKKFFPIDDATVAKLKDEQNK